MLTKIRHRLAQEEGFTLIELLVVVLIIGILAAVAIPTFLSQRNKANIANLKSDLKNAQTVVEAYANGQGGQYPAGTATPVSTAFSGDSDAASLSTVSYTATAGSADTYLLSDGPGSTSPSDTLYLGVSAGQAIYCSTALGADDTGANAPPSTGWTDPTGAHCSLNENTGWQ